MTYYTMISIETPDEIDGEEVTLEEAQHALDHILEDLGAYDTRLAQAGIKVHGSVVHS